MIDETVLAAQQAVEERREQDHIELAERTETLNVLREGLDEGEFEVSARLLRQHVAGLPEEEREKLETEFTADGRRLGNDPETIVRYAMQARSAPAWLLEEAKKNHGGNERLAIEALMGAPYGSPEWRKYWKDDRIQARYRDIVRADPDFNGPKPRDTPEGRKYWGDDKAPKLAPRVTGETFGAVTWDQVRMQQLRKNRPGG